MPFTFSHPAIVLSLLKKKHVSATALIIGAMSPDLEYFFRMKIQSEISHTLLGIFMIDLPLGLVVSLLFYEFIKQPLIENLPAFFQKRLTTLKVFNWLAYMRDNFLIVLFSFFLGALSHIFWDSMTHWDGFLVQRITFFNELFLGFPVYKIAQHVSSVIGLFFIALYFLRLPEEKVNVVKVNLKYWLVVFISSIVLVLIRFFFGDASNNNKIGNIIVSLISSIVLAASLVGMFFRNQKKFKNVFLSIRIFQTKHNRPRQY